MDKSVDKFFDTIGVAADASAPYAAVATTLWAIAVLALAALAVIGVAKIAERARARRLNNLRPKIGAVRPRPMPAHTFVPAE